MDRALRGDCGLSDLAFTGLRLLLFAVIVVAVNNAFIIGCLTTAKIVIY